MVRSTSGCQVSSVSAAEWQQVQLSHAAGVKVLQPGRSVSCVSSYTHAFWELVSFSAGGGTQKDRLLSIPVSLSACQPVHRRDSAAWQAQTPQLHMLKGMCASVGAAVAFSTWASAWMYGVATYVLAYQHAAHSRPKSCGCVLLALSHRHCTLCAAVQRLQLLVLQPMYV